MIYSHWMDHHVDRNIDSSDWACVCLQDVTDAVLDDGLKQSDPDKYQKTVADNILRLTYYW